MKFILEIKTGNDAMLGYDDLGLALQELSLKFKSAEGIFDFEENEGKILDRNGQSVGKWSLQEDGE